MMGSLQFLRVCRKIWKTSQTVSHSLSISNMMFLVSLEVVEVLTDECVEVLENSRLDPYSNERLLYFSEMGVKACWGRGHEVMLVEKGIFGPRFAITARSVKTTTLCC